MRSFEDHRVIAVPSEDHIARLEQLYPGLRVELHATPGRKLSDEFQDGKSYRYGVLNIGGRDRDDVIEQFAACRDRIGIEFVPLAAHEKAAESASPPPPNLAQIAAR